MKKMTNLKDLQDLVDEIENLKIANPTHVVRLWTNTNIEQKLNPYVNLFLNLLLTSITFDMFIYDIAEQNRPRWITICNRLIFLALMLNIYKKIKHSSAIMILVFVGMYKNTIDYDVFVNRIATIVRFIEQMNWIWSN